MFFALVTVAIIDLPLWNFITDWQLIWKFITDLFSFNFWFMRFFDFLYGFFIYINLLTFTVLKVAVFDLARCNFVCTLHNCFARLHFYFIIFFLILSEFILRFFYHRNFWPPLSWGFSNIFSIQYHSFQNYYLAMDAFRTF